MTTCPTSEVSCCPLFFPPHSLLPQHAVSITKCAPRQTTQVSLYPPTHRFLEAQKTSTHCMALCLTPFQVPQGLGASATAVAMTCHLRICTLSYLQMASQGRQRVLRRQRARLVCGPMQTPCPWDQQCAVSSDSAGRDDHGTYQVPPRLFDVYTPGVNSIPTTPMGMAAAHRYQGDVSTSAIQRYLAVMYIAIARYVFYNSF